MEYPIEKIISDDIYSFESNDFFDFYSKIVSSTVFKRMANSEVKEYLKSNKLPDSNIIFSDSELSVVYSNPTLDKLCSSVYMISDPNDTHRYLFVIMMHGYCTSIKLFGNFVYFNSGGNVTQLVVIPKMLLNYDYRNGRVDKSNTFLYNQSIVFVESHRDTRKYIITVCCFGYYDDLQGIHTSHTDIKSKYFSSERDTKQYGRFLVLEDDDKKVNLVIDLGSTYAVKKDSTNATIFRSSYKSDSVLKYTIYELANLDNPEHIFPVLKSKPAQTYSDPYEANCIKCDKLTSSAVFYEGNMSMGLGKSYCHDCGIRYSLSDRKWVCAKLRPKSEKYLYTTFCAQEVNKESEYICSCPHDDCELKFKFNFVEKKPYKKDGSVVIKNQKYVEELDNLSD